MIGILSLTRALNNFEKVAEGVEKAVRSKLKDNNTIVWRMTYNWMPDDGESGREMTPEYQPIMFGSVSIINRSGWNVAVCTMNLNVDCFVGESTAGCTLDNCSGNTTAVGTDEIVAKIASDLNLFLMNQ